MTHTHIIPDIHGQLEKLEGLLATLGWQRSTTGWRGDGQLAFLGDFIDRGPANGAVLRIVRDLIDGGHAVAVMGNHELNAIHYHHTDPNTGQHYRPHTAKNTQQHASFLAEFPVGAPATREWITWLTTLPLWQDRGDFRLVHACWSEPDMAALDADHGFVLPETLITAGASTHPLNTSLEVILKGPETDLPPGYGFHDEGGHRREQVRLAWWRSHAETWREAVSSVPDLSELPGGPMPSELKAMTYDPAAKPVFYGHYWMTGALKIESPNALCLDYSAGKSGPLIAYRFEPGDKQIMADRVVGMAVA
ncbi:MAG: metallophosphoesterase [Pseudomonadota bacterium]